MKKSGVSRQEIKPKRLFAQAVKEIKQLKRDRLTVSLALILPLIFQFLLSFAVSLEVHSVPLAIQDLDLTSHSRELIATFQGTNRFRIVASGPSVNVPKMLNQTRAVVGLIIPPGFSRDISRSNISAQVQILVDGTNANTADIVQGYVEATVNSFVEKLEGKSTFGVKLQSRFWFNPGLKNIIYIGPGAIAITLTLFPPLLAGLATAKEREQGTIIQVYASSLTGTEYLLGKAIAFWLVGIAEVFLVVLAGRVFLDLWFVGDPTPWLVGSILYIACSVFWGIFLGCCAYSQSVVIDMVDISSFLISMLMSGGTYPIANIPVALRWISNFVPARYYVFLSRDSFVKGVGWSSVWGAVLALGLLASFFFFLAWRKMQKMQVD